MRTNSYYPPYYVEPMLCRKLGLQSGMLTALLQNLCSPHKKGREVNKLIAIRPLYLTWAKQSIERCGNRVIRISPTLARYRANIADHGPALSCGAKPSGQDPIVRILSEHRIPGDPPFRFVSRLLQSHTEMRMIPPTSPSSKHDTLTQFWVNAGSSSETAGQH